jgi:ribonuclease P protein component
VLTRRARLGTQREIRAVMRQGRRVITPWVKIYFQPTDRSELRAACIAGKVVSASAVKRHRYQRWLREVIQRLSQEQPPLSYDMVWVATPALTALARWQELGEKLTPFLIQEHLIRNASLFSLPPKASSVQP